ncbi:amino acid ABC transporter permease [Paenibacillus taiwanensis]|uniref:amino acid ABC transporter permease n=1 Tax=Paenibacillus taiwanensis TaxID=401638 RepID=UPI0004915975|nr:amino acid ABC transporter permease [Paenibacillus taiwanensis]
MNMFQALWDFKTTYLSGMGMTILLSISAILIGFILGLLLVLMRRSAIAPLRWFSATYVEVFRGTPLLVQLFIIYFGLSEYGVDLPKFTSGAIAVALNSAAYLAEIFRAGIQGVNQGQVEAARSLGMTKSMTMRYIVLPQALRNVMPAIGNEFITIIKESSIVTFIGIADLMFQTEVIRNTTYASMGPLLGCALCYFIMTFTLSKMVGLMERKFKYND